MLNTECGMMNIKIKRQKYLFTYSLLPIAYSLKISLLIFTAFLFSISSYAQNAELRAQVSTTTPAVGQPFTYSITVNAQGGSIPRPQIPDMPDFEKIGSSTSQNFSIINGAVSVAVSFVYTLVPKRAGHFVIPPAVINISGQTIHSNSIEIDVGQAQQSLPQSQTPHNAQQPQQNQTSSSGVKVGINIIPSKTKVYLGEPVTLSTVVFGNTALAGYSLEPSSPQGFWMEEAKLPDKPEIEKQIINGEQYYNVLVRRQIIFPTTTGKLKIPSTKGVVRYLIRRQERSPFDDFFNDPFFRDPFFNDPFFRHPFFNRSVVVEDEREAVSNSPEITVVPLPEKNRPFNFNGAVGRFKIKAELEKNEAKAGEAVTVTVTVEGQGNLKGITFSGYKDIPGLNLFSSSADASFTADKYSYNAVKKFEYVLVPLSEGKYTIPSAEFSYFDPIDRMYKTLRSDTMLLLVTPGAPQQSLSVAGSQILKDQQNDIIEIHNAVHSEVIKSDWKTGFVLWNLLPIVIVLTALLYKRHIYLLETDPKYGGIILSKGAARKYLKNAARILTNNKPKHQEEFYEELMRAVSKYVGHRFRIAESAVQPELLRELLKEKVPEELIGEIRDIISKCHFARYSSSAVTIEDEIKDLRECEKLIKELDRI